MRSFLNPVPRRLVVALGAVVLSGCATFTPDGGLNDVSRLTQERIGQPVALAKPQAKQSEATATQVQALLAQPLTADSAVQLALLNSPALKVSLAELGISEAEWVQSGRLRNPGFSFGRVRGADETEIERSVTFDVIGLLTMPVRQRIEGRRFEQAKLLAATQAVQLAAETRRAYYTAVAAAQSAAFADQVRLAAEASSQLADRMSKVGNWSKLDQARERAFYADAVTELARARHEATAAREQLTRLLGVWGAQQDYRLPDRLPDLPAQATTIQDAEARALSQRLDVLAARRDAQATASALGLTKATRFINVFDAAYTNTSKSGSPRENGYEVSLELPLFDWGTAARARAEAVYMQSVQRTADTAIKARSQVRETYSAYHTAYDIARHYRDEVVPLRKKISDEVLLRYNGMLASTFELLADAREQLTSVNGAIAAQRDFWIAESQLQSAMNGGGMTQ